MKKKSLKVKVVELAKKEMQQIKGGTQDMADLQETVCTGKKKGTATLQ